MLRIRSWASWFFIGVRLFLPLIPVFIWIAFQRMFDSTVKYWKDSQSVVDEIAEVYMSKVPLELTSDYDPGPYWVCYATASFLYLLAWLAMSWLTVAVVGLLISAIF